MTQAKPLMLTAQVGEEIGKELGAQMIASYRTVNPTETTSYFVGRNVLEQILAQPGCVGVKFYDAYNEAGEKVLVYVGATAQGTDILEVVTINTEGKLAAEKGIVADRGIKLPDGITTEENWWEL